MRHPNREHVAYFSMEIALKPTIPTYSGGLGVLAGDTLKSCADMSLPVVATTLCYRKGYFTQKLDKEGNQSEEEVKWNPSNVLKELPVQVEVEIEGRKVKVKAWEYLIKGVTGHENPVLFLDTDVEGNSPYDRTITDKLYANDQHYRLAQEIILGIGGVKMLKALGYNEIQKYHMNEGHSALLTLELAKNIGQKCTIDNIRNKCVFTTHTPVPAGHDSFPKDLAELMLGNQLPRKFIDHMYHDGKMNMTYLGLNFSGHINGVAKKHSEVSRHMFPGYKIESITNGIHSGYWTCKSFKDLFNEHIPGWDVDPQSLRGVLSIPNRKIWDAHIIAKKELINYVKEKNNVELDPEVFTIGFARRAATYKRGDLLFSDIERLRKIAKEFGGLQIIYAGKAHPNDWEGKQIIKRIVGKMKSIEHDIKVCYLENYDLDVAQVMIPGVDIWLNTPQCPKEASGTSGMKAAHNGVPQLSILDGWWIEGHIENVTGWSIGNLVISCSTNPNQESEVQDLYTKLEYVILPAYTKERERWINVMKNSIAINGSYFNTHRMVQQYVTKAYYPESK